jgi:hypothetical protein
MARRGSKPGERRGGRQRGTPNKIGADVRELARKYTKQAIQTLADIMVHGEAETARAMAADKLLDRGWGKPQQQHEVAGPGGGPIPCSWLTAEEAKALGWA